MDSINAVARPSEVKGQYHKERGTIDFYGRQN